MKGWESVRAFHREAEEFALERDELLFRDEEKECVLERRKGLKGLF